MKVTYFSQIKSKIWQRDHKKTLKQHIKVFPVNINNNQKILNRKEEICTFMQLLFDQLAT